MEQLILTSLKSNVPVAPQLLVRNRHIVFVLDDFLSIFQVFNMNAPVPPASDGPGDSLKQPGQFSGGYGQGFGSQTERAVDQADIAQETLQSGEGGHRILSLILD